MNTFGTTIEYLGGDFKGFLIFTPKIWDIFSNLTQVRFFKRVVQPPTILSIWSTGETHPQSLTWNLKLMVSNRNLLFQGLIYRFHVKLQGCISEVLLPWSLPVANQVADWTPCRDTVDGSEIRRAPVEVGSLSQYFSTGFIHPRWWSPDFWTINRMTNSKLIASLLRLAKNESFRSCHNGCRHGRWHWGHSIRFGAGVDVSYGWSFKGNVGAEIVTWGWFVPIS